MLCKLKMLDMEMVWITGTSMEPRWGSVTSYNQGWCSFLACHWISIASSTLLPAPMHSPYPSSLCAAVPIHEPLCRSLCLLSSLFPCALPISSNFFLFFQCTTCCSSSMGPCRLLFSSKMESWVLDLHQRSPCREYHWIWTPFSHLSVHPFQILHSCDGNNQTTGLWDSQAAE